MSVTIFSKGASIAGAPFAFWLFVFSLFISTPVTAIASACPASQPLQRAQVVYVYDGDTVKLQDGRKLRLIGINTPENGKGDAATQPLADDARAALQQLINNNNRTLWLQYGREDQDRYGRLLAHAFLDNGDNVAARLLQQGLAATLVVPPNTWGEACYQRIENEARIDRLGLWATPRYQAIPAATLPLDTRGFHIVLGKVTAIRQSRHSVWVELDGPLTLQINRQNMPYFGSLQSLIGKDIEARGWIKADGNDGLRMRIQHPAALLAISARPATP